MESYVDVEVIIYYVPRLQKKYTRKEVEYDSWRNIHSLISKSPFWLSLLRTILQSHGPCTHSTKPTLMPGNRPYKTNLYSLAPSPFNIFGCVLGLSRAPQPLKLSVLFAPKSPGRSYPLFLLQIALHKTSPIVHEQVTRRRAMQINGHCARLLAHTQGLHNDLERPSKALTVSSIPASLHGALGEKVLLWFVVDHVPTRQLSAHYGLPRYTVATIQWPKTPCDKLELRLGFSDAEMRSMEQHTGERLAGRVRGRGEIVRCSSLHQPRSLPSYQPQTFHHSSFPSFVVLDSD